MSNHEYTKTKTVQNKKLTADSVTLQKQKQKQETNVHVPVLMEEVISSISPKKGDGYLDLTAGYGGHAQEILRITNTAATSTLVDRDINAVQAVRSIFPDTSIFHTDSAAAATQLLEEGKRFDVILADIGVSSPHLDDSSRGFSFKHEGPLDMRMDQSQTLTAEEIVNTYTEEDLADIFYTYGEEYASRRVAKAVVTARPLKTTTELADAIRSVLSLKKTKHPEAKCFQALRIYVNAELKQLESMLEQAPRLLNPGGRLGIISFHSLEDRMVKKAFSELGPDTLDAEFTVLTRKPRTSSEHETVSNPRARSAKLRVLQRK